MGGVGSGREPGPETAAAQRFACPSCGAGLDQPCRTINGATAGRATAVHAARRTLKRKMNARRNGS